MKIQTFSVLFAELRASAYVQIQTISDNLEDFSDSILEFVREEIRQDTGVELSANLVASMNVSNGAGAYWLYRIDDRLQGAGEFKLRHLREVFLEEPEELWSDDTPEQQKQLLKTLRYFDYRPGAGDDKFAAFALQPGTMPPPIWYYDRGDCFRMTLDYEGYLQALIVTKGITDWQYLFSEVDWSDDAHKGLAEKLRQRLDALAVIFPQHDYAAYYTRLPKGA
jgi:hypothetical protein